MVVKKNHLIQFNFEAGQKFDVVMSEKELKQFLLTISKSEVYWDAQGGFWIAFSKLLFFTVKEIKNEMESHNCVNSGFDRMEKEPTNHAKDKTEAVGSLFGEVWSY